VIVRAVEDALSGRVDAIATAPVSKEAFALARLPWKGHTDLLGHLTRSEFVAMMFESPALRVVLANAAAALLAAERVKTLGEGVGLARQAIALGRARQVLETLQKLSA